MMKNFISALFVFGFCMSGHAQQYEIQIDVGVRSSLNPVQCYSNVDLRINHASAPNSNWRWYQGFNMGTGVWQYFTRTIAFDASDKVTSIDVYSDRVIDETVGGCKSHGGGKFTITIPDGSYPCATPITHFGIPGYDANTYVTVTIRPLTSVYVIKTEGTVVPSVNTVEFDYFITLKMSDNSLQHTSFAAFRSIGNGQKELSREALIMPNRNLRVTEIQVRSVYLDFSSFPFRFVDQTNTYPVVDTNADFDVTLTNPFTGTTTGSSLRVFYGQVNTPVNGPSDYTLPSGNNVTLSIPELIPENYSSYVWQYDDGSGFQNFPSGFGNTKTVTFSGQSLFGANYQNQFFKNIIFRAAYCGRYSGTVTLRYKPSAPGIVSVVPTPETCYGQHDAKLKITFDRPLYASLDEQITVVPNNLITPDFANLTLDANNSVTVQSTSLTPGAYTITLLDKYVNGNTGYTDGPQHTTSTTVPPRLPISNFTAIPADVHCYAGQDGFITVSAQGGTSQYTAFLNQGAIALDTISLTEAASSKFTDLVTSTAYTVTLKDSNGCDPKDASTGNVIVLNPTVSQPSQQVSLMSIDNTEPLGFGLTNGHVAVRTQGGTMPHDFTWVDVNNNTLTSDPPVQQGTSTVDTLSNIGKGTYRVTTRDANYALASPATVVNLRGCYDTLTFFVTQPPLLEVAMDEKHFVSCYGYTDGELVAHAKGGRPFLSGPTQPYLYEWFVVSPLTAFGSSDSIQIDRFSTTYRVKVTDRNGIIAWSPDFTLIQPDPLLLSFNTSQLLCNGDSNGTSTVLPVGGTSPYLYQWSTDATTQSVSNLTDGFYSVIVKDTRKCTTYGQTEVKVPNSLIVSPQVKQPTCNNYTDGTIQLNASGGNPGYTYVWQHGPSTDIVQNLGQGNYEVKVTDANGCFIVRDFIMDNPGLLPVNLGPDRVLCKDQTLPLDVTITDPLATYTWTKNGTAFSNTASVVLSDAATYVARVVDSNGCANQDDIAISRDQTEIAADFVVATRLPKNQSVRITNISFPYPDNIEWIIPGQAQVQDQKPEYLELIFPDYGDYSIGLKSFKGLCEKTIMQTVRVVTSAELADYQAPDEPYIKQFSVSPNPNNGRFTTLVQLKEVADFKLVVYSSQGTIIADKDVKGVSFATTDFDVSAQVSSGVYVLELITTQGLSYIKVLIQ
jgi:hypothetical protein